MVPGGRKPSGVAREDSCLPCNDTGGDSQVAGDRVLRSLGGGYFRSMSAWEPRSRFDVRKAQAGMTKDPYRYFRVEARDLLEGITRATLELEKGGGDKSLVSSLLRLAHTLKGASRVVKQPEIAEAAHAMESVLSPYREGGTPVPKESAAELLRLADDIAERVEALDACGVSENAVGAGAPHSRSIPAAAVSSAAPAEQGAASGPIIEEPTEIVRVDVQDVESLRKSLAQLGVQIASFQSETETVRRARRLAGMLVEQLSWGKSGEGVDWSRVRTAADQLRVLLQRLERDFTGTVRYAERELAQTHEGIERLRLIPVNVIFPSLARTVRDASVTLGKQALLDTAGGDIRVDAHILPVLRDALLHVLRNAVAHGIEPPAIRIAAGKPPGGRIRLRIERRGSSVAFVCADDGSGVDTAAVGRAAVKAGAITARQAESLGREEAVRLVLAGGLSTTGTVTGISGRGIGMDAVRDAARRLKGEVAMETTPGSGTTLTIVVPVSLISVSVLKMDAGAARVAIPLSAVRRVMYVAERDITHSQARETIALENQAIPFLRLSQALGIPAALCGRRSMLPVAVIASGQARAAIGPDRLAGVDTVLVRAVPALAAARPEVAGVYLDVEGNPEIVLDPEVLLRTDLMSASDALPDEEQDFPPLLVIDDSLTTRMLEQSILESAGYSVELAKSGEEALEKARQRRYGVFLVDIEMPGIDGFEFLERARRAPLLRETPSILVTSRESREDRARGEELGARAFIVKSEFDQEHLLAVIRRLLLNAETTAPGGDSAGSHGPPGLRLQAERSWSLHMRPS